MTEFTDSVKKTYKTDTTNFCVVTHFCFLFYSFHFLGWATFTKHSFFLSNFIKKFMNSLFSFHIILFFFVVLLLLLCAVERERERERERCMFSVSRTNQRGLSPKENQCQSCPPKLISMNHTSYVPQLHDVCLIRYNYRKTV